MPEIDPLVREMVDGGASDLHLSCDRAPRVRVGGDMLALALPPWGEADLKRILYEIVPERNQREFEATHDTDFAYEVAGVARLRVNVFRDRFGLGAVARVIPCRIIPAEELELPQSVLDLCRLSKGLVLVTGPTGSGKSTTLAAMVDFINRSRAAHILTIEDPIEFVHEDKQCMVTQREVHSHTQSFARALRAGLRQDPDIVLVGEMRDLETIEIALETAETGHLVFATLHANTAPSTIDRIIDVFPADRQAQIRVMLAASLKGVIAQTLCKRTDRGRVAALEIMIVDQGISALIRDGRTHQIASAMQVGRGLGAQLLNDALATLVREGSVAAEEAYLKAVDKADLLARLQKFGLPPPILRTANEGRSP